MKDMPGMGKAKQATTATGTGTVTAVNIQNRKVTLDHGPIPDINWPAIKMEFATAPSVDLWQEMEALAEFQKALSSTLHSKVAERG